LEWKGIAAKGEEDQVPPMGVGGRLGLKDDRDEQSDVLNTLSLVVKLRHEGISRIVPDDRVGRRAVSRRAGGGGPNVVVGRKDEMLLRVGDLAGQCIGGILLALPSEGSRTYTSLALGSRGTGSDEDGGEGGIRTTGVEVGWGRRWRGGEGRDTLGQHTPLSRAAVAPRSEQPQPGARHPCPRLEQ